VRVVGFEPVILRRASDAIALQEFEVEKYGGAGKMLGAGLDTGEGGGMGEL